MTDLSALTAREAARRIEAGTLTAEALTRACLDRIAAREPAVNAWEFLDPEQAIAEARARDRAPVKGRLHGVPVGVKDVIDTADMPTGYGSAIYQGKHRPAADAACVALMREAGAVALGKTVTTEFATFRPGKTANPHHPGHTPGGSSSGSAAAVADGMVPLAFGTQTAGSVIRPAAFCGCVGYKPSYGTINRVGVKMISDTLDTVGVFARTVADAAFFAAVLTARPALEVPEEGLPKPRLALCRTPEWEHAGDGARAALDAARDALAGAGVDLPDVESIDEQRGLAEAQVTVMNYELARCLADERLRHPEKLSPRLRRILEEGLAISPEDYDRALAAAARGRAALARLFGEYDALVVPAAPGEAPAGLQATGDPVFNRAWTLLRTPCVTIPAWRGASNLPVGVQLVGRIGDDARVLRAAAFLEQALR